MELLTDEMSRCIATTTNAKRSKGAQRSRTCEVPFAPLPAASRSRPDNQRDGRLTGEASTAATCVRTLNDLTHTDGQTDHGLDPSGEQTMAPLMTRVAVGRMRRVDADDDESTTTPTPEPAAEFLSELFTPRSARVWSVDGRLVGVGACWPPAVAS